MGRPFPICMRDFTVKQCKVNTGPSIIKEYFTIFEDGKDIGSLTSCKMIELGDVCSGTFLYRKWGSKINVARCLFDAVKDIIDSDSVETVDLVCGLLLNIGLEL